MGVRAEEPAGCAHPRYGYQAGLLQGADGVAHRGPGEIELPGELAHASKCGAVVEQVDEELGLYWAQTTLLGLPAEEEPEDLGESFERGDDLLVYIPVLRGRLEDRSMCARRRTPPRYTQARNPLPWRTVDSIGRPEGLPT